jgi:hypothetical protein
MADPPRAARMVLSPQSRVNDTIALFDSYGLEVKKDGLILFSGALFFLSPGCVFESRPYFVPSMKAWESFTQQQTFFPKIDPSLSVRMVRWQPSPDNPRTLTTHTRWPFYVDDPLAVYFSLEDQWWEFGFTPGSMYEERRIQDYWNQHADPA